MKFRFLNGANVLSTPIQGPTSWVKEKQKEQQDKATLAEVVKEMAKPPVATSARERSPNGSKRSASREE